MTIDEDLAHLLAPAGAPRQSIAAFAGVIAGLTLFAAAAGAALGLRLATPARTQAASVLEKAQAKTLVPYQADISLRDLPPIIANLADPQDTWVRLQATLVLDAAAAPRADADAAEIAGDILGFVHTLTLTQIAGASGLQHLREDLNERAVIRSNGRVRELILQTLVVQ